MKLLHLTSLLTPILIPGTFALREDGGDSGLSKSLRERDAALTATPDGICHIYTVQAGETCGALATRYGITTANIETWNAGAWGWTGCTGIKQGDFICLSSGDLPMPASLPQAVCGPQVPGAARPIRYSDVGSLNPCVSGQCCSQAGKCGITSEFCGRGCISNCKQADELVRDSASSQPTAKPTNTTPKTTSSIITTSKTSTLTTEKKVAKATTSETPVPTWQVTIYKDKGCESDEYLSIQGHETSKNIKCINLADDINTDINDNETSCRKWTDEGLNWGSCKGQKITTPKSYFITRGQCMIYGARDCATNSYQGDVRNPAVGCQFPSQASWSPEDFVSMRCYDNEYGVHEDTTGWYPEKSY